MAPVDHLACSRCGARLRADRPATVCPEDGGVLYARYALPPPTPPPTPEAWARRSADMWRYAELLPDAPPVTLGEGLTPLLPSRTLPHVRIKDEGRNPTGSFKARGLSAAVTMARALGLQRLAIPSAGNAASALAAYAAAAGIEAHVFMPRDAPLANRVECQRHGARVTLVDGLISDCARLVAERAPREGWFDVSTLKEPYRLEGKKTMGLELAEQLGWRLPDAVVFPTGGGVGLIGMWKAFDELGRLGWIGPKRPRMVAVQAAGCAPVVKAWAEGKPSAEPWPGAATMAHGLRVPRPYGDALVLEILRESGGAAVAVSDAEILDALGTWAREEGILAAPEGAASLAGYRALRRSGFFRLEDEVVLFNTGLGVKYLEVLGSPA